MISGFPRSSDDKMLFKCATPPHPTLLSSDLVAFEIIKLLGLPLPCS